MLIACVEDLLTVALGLSKLSILEALVQNSALDIEDILRYSGLDDISFKLLIL